MLGIPQMHKQGINGDNILVAVLDGGFRGVDTAPYFKHLFENQQYIDGYDFVGNNSNIFRYGQHGTEALSCIVGYEAGKLEAAAYGADVMLYVTEDGSSEYRIEEYNWLFAAERADSVGAHIISTSLGYTTFDDNTMNYTYNDLNGETTVITQAANMATAVGIVCVASAGNEGAYSWKYVSAPADAPDILAVGAVSLNQSRVSFSSIGPTVDGRIKPEVSALGLQTVVGDASGNITTANGTSFAAPLVTGLVAGFWQAHPQLTNLEVMENIKASGSTSIAPNNEIGYGVPDFNRATEIVLDTEEEIPLQNEFEVYPNPIIEGKLFITSHQPHQGNLVVVILQNSTGQTLLTKTFSNAIGTEPLSLDISTLNPGVYILQISSPKATDTVKLIRF
jgi:serine protease AprX